MAKSLRSSLTLKSKAPPADKEINLFDGDGLILRIAPSSQREGRRIGISDMRCQWVRKEPKWALGPTSPHSGKSKSLARWIPSLLCNRIDPQVHNNNKANALKNATEHTLQTVARKWLGWEGKDLRYLTRPCRRHLAKLGEKYLSGLGNVPITEIRPQTL